jgi:hypothetical protein
VAVEVVASEEIEAVNVEASEVEIEKEVTDHSEEEVAIEKPEVKDQLKPKEKLQLNKNEFTFSANNSK